MMQTGIKKKAELLKLIDGFEDNDLISFSIERIDGSPTRWLFDDKIKRGRSE